MGLWKDKGTGLWSYKFQYQKRQFGGRGYKTKGAARTAREDRRKDVRSTESIEQTPFGMDFRTMASHYLDYGIKRYAGSVYKYKLSVYKRFISFAGNPLVNEITPEMVMEYLITLPSNNQFNVQRKELSAAFTYAINILRVMEYNPCRAIEKLPHTPEVKELWTEKEFLKIILAADPKTDERDLIWTVFFSLARIDEILRLRWSDVNFDIRELTKWTRKRKGGAYEPIKVAMNQDLYEVMLRRWHARTQDEWVFFNKRTGTRYNHRPKLMRALCTRAGVPYHGFHTVRHFVSNYLSNTKKIDTKVLQQLLGHKDERTTRIYIRSLDESVRAATDALNGTFFTNLPRTAATDEKEELSNDMQLIDFTGRGGGI